MLDIKFIHNNIDAVRQNISDRLTNADVDNLIALHEKRSRIVQSLDSKRQARNNNAKKMKGKLDNAQRQALIAEGRSLKEDIAAEESLLAQVDAQYRQAHAQIPNMTHPEAPRGANEEFNKEIRRFGSIPQFNFTAQDHTALGEALDLFDFETASRVSGAKFYYLKNEAVFLEMALLRYAMDIVKKAGFTMLSTPDIAREEIAAGLGFNPRGEESTVYTIEDSDACLIGTSEITLGGYYAGQTIPREKLPVRLAGLSHCFRKEAGAAGQFSKGLYRVHQFSKLELFVYAHPSESGNVHEELRSLEQDIFSGLDIPFRVVDICTGDLGAPKYRQYDLEAWMPGRGAWGEITSTSNCSDYQARRLNIHYKDASETAFVHMLNGTAMAVPRVIISILENFQESDGSVSMPPALRPYLGFDRIRAG